MVQLNENFYDELMREIAQQVNNINDCVWTCKPIDSEETYHSMDCYIGADAEHEAFIDLEVKINAEWVDESFDHAFGTWKDPNPHYEVRSWEVVRVKQVSVTDEDDNEVESDIDIDRIEAMTGEVL